MGRTNPDFQNGVPELLVLKLLAKREMYGYEIVREIQRATEESLSYGEGSVYPVLHGLESRRLVRTRQQSVSGRTRTYYTLTAGGRKRLEQLVTEFNRTVGAVRMVLGDANA